MRDWTLLSVEIDWHAGRLGIWLRDDASALRRLFAEDLRDVHVPRQTNAPSGNIEQVERSVDAGERIESLTIRMRSGEVIRIAAGRILMPA